ncbi:unnamed protein product [Ilex paraguariensis]|uniref:Uncharacterized protein n=1 Tax=Ilex paraguariensis TaxID=185542 RepID=A0ABC8RF07_9AQUA
MPSYPLTTQQNYLPENTWQRGCGVVATLLNELSLPLVSRARLRTGKATTRTDVYAFGAFVLEVACGRRPIKQRASSDQDLILVDWVFSCWSRGEILQTVDPNLGTDYIAEEVELVLKLGLLCSHSEPLARPTMRQVEQYLEGAILLPELSSLGMSATGLTFAHNIAKSQPSFMEKASSVVESLLSGGR